MKESQAEKSLIENAAFDPIFMRQLGLDFLSAAALQAKRYMYKYGITAEQCAKVAVKNRGNAKNNPFAQEPMDIRLRMCSIRRCSPHPSGSWMPSRYRTVPVP